MTYKRGSARKAIFALLHSFETRSQHHEDERPSLKLVE
jgi:hypothetical protein